MTPITVALLTFALALAGIVLGGVFRRFLPESHLNPDSKEVVKLSMGLVATLAALVLGLLVASAKSSYDARESDIQQLTAYVIMLDNLLKEYGTPEANTARASLRRAIPPVVGRIWREGQFASVQSAPFKASPEGEAFHREVQALQPENDVQRGRQTRIVQVTDQLMQTRFLLFTHLGSAIPIPFLAVLLLWIVVLCTGFSLMAPANITTSAALAICALSVAGAIFLILELDQPFSGVLMIPSEPLRNALTPLGP
jgi:hypothetical protein